MASTEDTATAARSPGVGIGPLDRGLRKLGLTMGQLCYAALALTVVSGVVLATAYDPAQPLASTEAIHGAISFGFLVQATHNLGAHLCIIALLAHTIDQLLVGAYRDTDSAVWWRATLLLPLIIAAAFTGFALRGDGDASAAHAIAYGVISSIPLVGDDLAGFTLGNPHGNLNTLYLHHVVTFTLLPWLIAIDHARRIWSGWLVFAAAFAVTTAAALLYHPGTSAIGSDVQGPWYFAAVQELLRYLPATMVALIFPLLMIAMLGSLGHEVIGRHRRIAWAWLTIAGLYLVATFITHLLGLLS